MSLPSEPRPTLIDLLRRRARENPARRVFTFLDAGGAEAEALTWGQLDERARGVAAALEQAGAVGERALLLHPPGLGFITSFLGCLVAGTVAVPAYPPGRNRAPARLRSVAADAQARVILAPAGIAAGAADLTRKAPELAGAVWIATDEIAPGLAGAWDRPSPALSEPAFLQYTSGSTSDPKGVVITHGNLLENEEAIRRSFGQSETSVVVGWLPLYHDMGLIGNVLQPLYAGGEAVLMAPLTFLERPARWLEAISRYQATTSGGPSFAYDLCARKVSEEEKDGLDLSRWAVAFNGAEPVRAETLDRFAAAFARCGFRREAFLPCYGLAEATLFVTGGLPEEPPVVRQVDSGALERGTVLESGEGRTRTLVSSGRAAPGQVVRIADPETLAPLGPGAVGEVLVAGPSVAAGYWRQPEETERTFGARLAGGEGPYLRTGDLGFLADGELFVTGRLKDLIILRGRNHYPQDFERTAEASHLALRPGGGAAFAVERDGEERLVILHEVERSQVDFPEVAAAVGRAVAEEHEVAVEEVVLLRRGTLLKTSSGKVRRAASRAAYLAGDLAVVFRSGRSDAYAPSPTLPRFAGEGATAPVGSKLAPVGGEGLRELLAQEAARVLRRDGIDPDAPLTALGLDSLAATELRNAVEERTGVALPLTALLEGISLSALETEVRVAAGSEVRPSLPAEMDAPGEHPLSEGQRALWFVDRLDPGAAALHLAGAARILGDVDGAALRRAITLLNARHPAFRTAFESRGGEPVRRVHEYLEPDFEEGAAEASALPGLLTAEAYRPFQVEQGPLLRVRLWHLSEGDAALLICVHHLIADYPSVAVLLRDLADLYRQERGGVPASLTPPGLGTTAWLQRREEALAGPRGERLRAWWHARLAGELPALDLLPDRPRPADPTWRGLVRTARVPGAADALHRLGRERGATLFAALLAAFQAVLHRWTGQDELLVGTPTAGRGPGLDGEIGYFVNPVVLRLGVSGEPTFGDMVEEAGTAALAAFEHGDYPFPRLARELRPEGDPARSPLFQAMFVLQPARSPEERALAAFALGEDGARARLGELDLESIALPEGRVQADVTLMAAAAEDGGLILSLQLDADLFEAATAARFLGHLGTFLEAALADSVRPALEVDLLSESERHQLAAWSAGPAVEPCLNDLIAEQVERTPAACALVHGEERTTYEELWDRAERLAAHLRGLGVGPEVRVGICAPRTPRLVVGLLAILESGGAYVPLDPAYPSERLAYLIEDSQAALLLVDRGVADRLPATGLPRVWLDEEPPPASLAVLRPRASPENLSHLIYTSGSTGRPKAVMVRHRSAVTLARWARRAFSARELDGVLAATSMGFDISVFELLVPFCWGGRVVLAGSALDLPDLPASAEVRLVNTVPSVMTELLRAGSLPASIETVNLAGEPVRQELVNALFAAGARRVTNLYGPSEDTTYSTIAELRPAEGGEPSIGRPVASTTARVLDRRMRPVPLGVAGELFLGGEGLARGYLGRPGLTAERFVPSPFPEDGPGARLYRTGDRTRWRADGELAFLGRLDFQVKIRGFRIELGEIETVLSAHPDVRQAVVMVLEDSPEVGSRRDRRLAAYVAADSSPSSKDLRSYLAERLPEHLIPSAFVVLESLPLNANGKVDRRALSRLAPEREATSGHEPPRTPLEATLAGLWEEVLGGRIGVHDNFFELGGHSLLGVRVQARIRERLGADVPLATLFRAPTVARLAPVVAAAPPWQLPPPVPRPRDGSSFPLSFAQERLWLLHRLRPGSAAYHVAAEVRLRGPLNAAALAATLRDLARCHEALRTRFPEAGDRPVQVVDPDSAPDLPRVCLAALPVTLRETEADRLAREEARQPFDLAAAPAVRARLVRLGGEEHRLLLTFHHIAVDEASLTLLARDLAASYDALAQGRPSPLVPSRLQVADAAVWERERAQGEALAARLAWWEERLAGLLPLQLPEDEGNGTARGDRGGAVSAILPAATVAAFAVLARAEGATPYMALLAGFQAFLSRQSGALDLAVGSPFANRAHPDLEGVVGPLLNTLVLRADLGGDPSFRELLGRVRESTLAAHERADVPLDLLVERLRPERGPGANPLFDVLFAFHRPPPRLRAAGVELEPRPVSTQTAKFDLTLFALEREEGIALELEYAAGLWEEATAVLMLDGLTALLACVAADPATRLSELPGLTAGERREVLLERRPVAGSQGPRGGPRTPVEELLAGIWEDLLGIERPDLGEDFFAAGGHSLLAARTVSRLRSALGVDLPLSALFEERTLAGQAARVEAALAVLDGGGSTPPLVPVPREDHPQGLPLSFGQERLWFLDRLEPGSPVYNMPMAARLDGDLDAEALRAAMAGITARHEVLRSAFAAPAGTPLQRAAPLLDLGLPRVDLSALSPEARQAEARRVSSADALRPFDLEAGPPLRATLLRLAAREHVLLVTVHHIAFDGWSIGVFLGELAALYAGAPALPPLAVQYGDFAVWQRRLLDSEALEPRLAWWRERLAGVPPVLALPLDRPRPPVQTFRGGHLHTTLAPETVRGVRELARRHEATAFMVCLAVWASLLARHAGEEDLVVGTAVAGRNRVELEPLIGLFAENLVLRIDLAGDPLFPAILARTRETVLAAWAHQGIPFERLVRELRPDRDLSHTPLYQTVLTLDASDRPPLELPGLRLQELPVDGGTAKFDLSLYLQDRRGEISGLLEYNRDLFDEGTAARLLAAFERLLAAVLPDVERRLSELPVLSVLGDTELRQVMSGGSPEDHPGGTPLVPELIAAADPRTPAVTGAKGETLSYGELDLAAARLARRLRALGVGPEVPVAVCLDRSPELIVSMLAIWKAGGVYVPFDPVHPEERLAWMAADSGAVAVLASRRGPVPPEPLPMLFLEDVRVEEGSPDTPSSAAPLLPESAAYLIYTSGSTGRPKGVVVTHGALAAYTAAASRLYGFSPGDRVLQSASPGFDLSLDEIIPCLAGGAELVMRDDAMLASASNFLEGCRARGITGVSLPTAIFHEIASRLEQDDLTVPPGLRLVILGGERLLPERLEAWRRRFPEGPRLLNTYGPTEATIIVTAADVTAPTGAPGLEAPLGRPLPGAGIWLLGRWGELVPPGARGEIAIGGSFLARGYLGQPDRTAERFVPHPFAATPGARLYRTGDLGRRLPDGGFEFAGRIDAQIKVRGYRVEPGELEAVLTRHPGVAAAAVTVWDDSAGRKRLVGYVVPRLDATSRPGAAEIRAFLAASLPEPLLPSELIFLDALPLNVHGKVDRKALPPPAGLEDRLAAAEHVPPRDEAERAIAEVWREVLNVERIGVHDPFFDLGGHSLALARVHVLLGERLGREVPLVDLFRHPTVASLAKHLSRTEPKPMGPAAEPFAVRAQERAGRRQTANRQGRFLEARKRLPPPAAARPAPASAPPPAAPWPAAAAAAHARLSRANAAFLRYAAVHPELLERGSFAELEREAAVSPYPLQPWPALVDRARVAEMERVSTGLVRLVKSLLRRVFADDPERLRDFYGLPGADLARSMIEEPNGLAGAVGRGDFLDSAAGLQCLELNLVSDLGGWQAPLWAEGYLRVPAFARFLREQGLRVACRDTVSALFEHVAAEALELGRAQGEVNVALVVPEGAVPQVSALEPWLAGRYARALRRATPSAAGALSLVSYSGLREGGGCLWAGGRRIHAAVEVHHEGTAAPAFRSFKAGTLKLFNAPVRTILTDKRNLALVSELADRGEVLEAAERELVQRHVPWTRRLAAASTAWRGGEAWLPELALAAREDLVIKRAREGQGAAVYLGAATPEPVWREWVERALAEGDWVVQERVRSLPYVHQAGERGWGLHEVVWGLFVFGDRYGGAFLSLAPRAEGVEGGDGGDGVVNLTRGASAGVVFEVLDDVDG